MRKKTNGTLRLTALAAALLSVYGPALAQDAQGEVSVGAGGWTNDRHQAGMYDGMRDKGVYPLLDADVKKRDDESGLQWGLKIRNLGLQTREIKGEVERQGDIGGSFEYNRIIKDNPFTIDTRVRVQGTREIVPNPGIVPGTGRDLELGVTRDRYTAKFYKSLGEGLTFNASYRIENKEGNRNWGRGGQAEFAIEPINSSIQIWEGALTYATDKLQLSGGYYGTAYNNSNGLLVTSYNGVPAAGSTFNLTLPLDNQSHEFFVNGGYNFTPTTRGTFKASYASATQNEFLPTARSGLIFPAATATSPSGAPIAIAPHHLNGRIDTTFFEGAINSRPIQDLTLNATVRYRNLEDKTPLKIYAAPSCTNGVLLPLCPVYNTPWSYKTFTGKMDATYRLKDGYSLLGGAEYTSQDRWVPSKGTLYVPFRADLNELTLRAGVRKAMSETVNGSLFYIYSDRDGGHYKKPGDPVGEDRINPINISDRKRNKIRGVVDWAPMDRVSVTLTGEYSHDDYSGLPDGLQKGKAYSMTLDGSYQLSEDWSAHAWASFDQTKADERTRNIQQTTEVLNAIRDNNLKENGTSFGAGFRGAVDKLKFGADLERFKSVNKYNQDINAFNANGVLNANLVPTPDITNKMLRLKAFATYPIQKNAEIRANFIYEKWQTDDWTWMMLPASGATPFAYCGTSAPCSDGTTVFADQKQNSVFGGLRYIYRFD